MFFFNFLQESHVHKTKKCFEIKEILYTNKKQIFSFFFEMSYKNLKEFISGRFCFKNKTNTLILYFVINKYFLNNKQLRVKYQ